MKLFFDARYIRTDYHDGVSRYTTELGNALASLSEVTFIICDPKQRDFLPDNAQVVQIHSPDSAKEPLTSLILNRYKPDMVYSPMQTIGSFGRKFKLILTLHDMTYYSHRLPPPQAKGLVRPLWRLFHMAYWPQRLVLNGADIVATVSETSYGEISAARLTKRPLIIVSNAARDLSPLLDEPVELLAKPPKNLIFMSTLLPYKNAEALIKAMEFLPGRTLHLLSKVKPERKNQLESLASSGVEVIFHDGVSDKQYAELLANDAIMVSASLSEGYGLPLAEALQLKVPAVVSDKPFYREIAGQSGAIYIDPNNPQAIARGVQSLDDLAKRKKIAQAGHDNLQKFSWSNSAQVLLDAVSRKT